MVQLAGELLLNAGAVAEDKADFPSRDDYSHDTMQLFFWRTHGRCGLRTAERELVLPLKPPPANEVAEQLKFDTVQNKFHPPRTSWRQIVELRRGRRRSSLRVTGDVATIKSIRQRCH